MPQTVKVMTLNVESGMQVTSPQKRLIYAWKNLIPHSSEQSLEKIAEYIRSENIDVAAFAEIDGKSRRSKKNQLDVVAYIEGESEQYHHVFFPTFQWGSFINQGNGIVSRHRLDDYRCYKLPGRGQKRYLCHAKIELGSKKLNILFTHLSLGSASRKRQIAHISKLLKEIGGPLILCGDFNTEDAQELAPIENILRNITSYKTYPSWNPKKAYDRMYASSHVKAVNTYLTPSLSDHLGIVAEIEIE